MECRYWSAVQPADPVEQVAKRMAKTPGARCLSCQIPQGWTAPAIPSRTSDIGFQGRSGGPSERSEHEAEPRPAACPAPWVGQDRLRRRRHHDLPLAEHFTRLAGQLEGTSRRHGRRELSRQLRRLPRSAAGRSCPGRVRHRRRPGRATATTCRSPSFRTSTTRTGSSSPRRRRRGDFPGSDRPRSCVRPLRHIRAGAAGRSSETCWPRAYSPCFGDGRPEIVLAEHLSGATTLLVQFIEARQDVLTENSSALDGSPIVTPATSSHSAMASLEAAEALTRQ